MAVNRELYVCSIYFLSQWLNQSSKKCQQANLWNQSDKIYATAIGFNPAMHRYRPNAKSLSHWIGQRCSDWMVIDLTKLAFLLLDFQRYHCSEWLIAHQREV